MSAGGCSGTVQVPAAALQQIMAALGKHDARQEKIETQLTPALGAKARYVALPFDGGHQNHLDPSKPGKNGNLYDLAGPLLADWLRHL